MKDRLSTPRASILLSILIAIVGYMFFIGSVRGAMNDREDSIAACQRQIATAQSAIAHASEIDRLTSAILKQVNGVTVPKNETAMISSVWFEAQRIATRSGITITDIHHDKVRSVSIASAAGQATPAPTGSCLPGEEATPTPAVAVARPTPAPVNLSALPIVIVLQGKYLNVISAIAAFSRANVLLRYDTSNWVASPDGTVVATTTLLAYPPLEVNDLGQPIDQFMALSASIPSPAPSPSAPASSNLSSSSQTNGTPGGQP